MANVSEPPVESEADLLAREAADAKKAILNTLKRMRTDLKNGVSPRELTVRHPLVALGASAAAGFVAASALTPGKDEEAKEKFARLQHAILTKLTPDEPVTDSAASNGRAAKRKAKDATSSDSSRLLRALARQGFNLLKPAIVSAISAAVTAKVTPPTDTSQTPQDEPNVV